MRVYCDGPVFVDHQRVEIHAAPAQEDAGRVEFRCSVCPYCVQVERDLLEPLRRLVSAQRRDGEIPLRWLHLPVEQVRRGDFESDWMPSPSFKGFLRAADRFFRRLGLIR